MTESEEGSLKVLLEEMNDKFSLVLEGHAALDGKMERFHKESKEDHRLAMDLIKFSHDELSAKIDGVGKRLDAKIDGVEKRLDAKIDGVGTELRETREELREEMASGFNALGSKVEGHEDRIRFLERKVA